MIYIVVLFFILLDQLSKYWIIDNFSLHESYHVLNFFDITHSHNKGSAFSFLATHNGWQNYFFILLAFVFTVYAIYHIRKYPYNKLENAGWALIASGAIGNLIDRVIYVHVVDFLSFHFKGYYFPIFNIADICIFIGAMLLIFLSFKKS